MNPLAQIRTINGHKQSLLKESGYKSINEAKKDYEYEGNDNEMYEILRDNYNGIIEQLQKQKKQLLNQQKNKNKSFLKDFNVEDETIRPSKENRKERYEFINSHTPDESVIRRAIPTQEDIKRFKNYNTEIKYINPEPVPEEFKSLSILNNTIPQRNQGNEGSLYIWHYILEGYDYIRGKWSSDND
jgi:hypothetical protein